VKYAVPDHDVPLSDEWLEPLRVVANTVRHHPAYQFFDEFDFMVMAKALRSSRPHITQYKHIYTRRYLHLDAVGRAYRYVPPTGRGDGRFLEAPSLEWALDALLLWELPWMKSELDLYRFDLPFDERWRLQPRFDPRRFLIDEVDPSRHTDMDDPPPDEPSRRLRLLDDDAF
jgi:hypothetical protein